MIPQLIQRGSDNRSRACERFFSERRIEFQTRDLRKRPLGPSELDAIARAVGGHAALIDEESRSYRNRGLEWQEYDAREELLADASLLRVPIVRTDQGAAVAPDRSALEALVAAGGAP